MLERSTFQAEARASIKALNPDRDWIDSTRSDLIGHEGTQIATEKMYETNLLLPKDGLEGLMLKLKLQYFGHLMRRADSFLEDTDAGKDWTQEEKGMTEDEMVGWHHWLNGHRFGWTLGVGDGQGGLACCGSWGRKESNTTERLNWRKVLSPILKQYFKGWR